MSRRRVARALRRAWSVAVRAAAGRMGDPDPAEPVEPLPLTADDTPIPVTWSEASTPPPSSIPTSPGVPSRMPPPMGPAPLVVPRPPPRKPRVDK